MGGVEFRVLGPVGIWCDGRQLGPMAAQQRSVLAMLLLDPGRVIPVGRLVSALWGDDPPNSARNAVQGYVSKLRRMLVEVPECDIVRSGQGYCLTVDLRRVDLHRFRELVVRARVGAPAEASGLLHTALRLWRGAALADVAGDSLLVAIGAGLAEEHLVAKEESARVDLELARHEDVVASLFRLVAEHPLRDRPVALLMTALLRCDRRAEALAVFREARQRFVQVLGIEPGEELRRVHEQVLDSTGTRQEPAPAVTVPRQLQADSAHFTGRERELAALCALLPSTAGNRAHAAIGTVVGTAGVGKTTLVAHWAQQVRHHFPDGQLHVNLKGFAQQCSAVDPSEALCEFLQALAVPAHRIPEGSAARAGLYRSLLADRRVLIVLDNARDAEQVRPLLPGAPGCLVVVTSRTRLEGLVAAHGAVPITVDLLSSTQARELLVGRLGAARTATEPEAVDEIVSRCAGLPLALAVVAARARVNPGFTLTALATELRRASGSLNAFQGEDPSVDVRTVFSWSYRILSPQAAQLFRLFGPHLGPDIATASAASLVGTSVERVSSALAELTRAQMITEHLPGRYTAHDLARAHATELTNTHDTAADQRAALHRLFDHYLHTAHTADRLLRPDRVPITLAEPHPGVTVERFTDHRSALDWLTTEHSSLLAAVEQSASTGFDAHTWQFAWTVRHVLAAVVASTTLGVPAGACGASGCTVRGGRSSASFQAARGEPGAPRPALARARKRRLR